MNKAKTLVPKLRFPEFRDAGEWEESKLGLIGTFTGGGTPSKDEASYWVGKNPWVSSSDISDDNIQDVCISRFISDKAIQETATKIVPANSILLVSRVGVGKLAITRVPICTSQDFTNFTPRKDDLVFLAYYLKTLRNTFLSFNQGMAIKGFTKDDVLGLEIFLPRLKEQQKIADCLASLDELITLEAQKLATLKTHKKGMMQQLFPAAGETVPKLRFPEFRDAGEWKLVTFGKLSLDVSDGNYSSKYPTQSDFIKIGVPFLRANNLKFGTVSDEDMRFISKQQHHELTKGHLKKGDILISTRGELGIIALVPDRHVGSNINAQLVRINSSNKIVNTFLFQLLDYSRTIGLFDALSTGTALKQLPIGKLNQLSLRIPEVPVEQKKIADCLASLDDRITAQTQKLATLKAHKKGLMQQLFPSVGGVDGEAGQGGL